MDGAIDSGAKSAWTGQKNCERAIGHDPHAAGVEQRNSITAACVPSRGSLQSPAIAELRRMQKVN
jgi:hypothetical protein